MRRAMFPSDSLMSAALSGRRAGDFASIVMISPSSWLGTSAMNCDGATGSRFNCRSAISADVSPVNGGRPATSS